MPRGMAPGVQPGNLAALILGCRAGSGALVASIVETEISCAGHRCGNRGTLFQNPRCRL